MFLNYFISVNCILLIHDINSCLSKTYDNFMLYSATPEDAVQLDFLNKIYKGEIFNAIFWIKPSKLFESAHLLIKESDNELFLKESDHYKLNVQLLQADVQSAFHKQVLGTHQLRDIYSWENYHEMEDINKMLTELATKFPYIVKKESIGTSAEGKDIFVICIGNLRYVNKPKVIVESGIHGNEWPAVEFATYLINELAHSYDNNNAALVELIQKHHWYIIPVLNPDGFVYSRTQDRLWRKNRRSFAKAVGVDLNRNFDYAFCKYDASEDPSHENFCGPKPFSEPETSALANFVANRKLNLKFYISLHSYGQKIIIPFSDRIVHLDNYATAENLGRQAMERIHSVNGIRYNIGTAYDTLNYRISGNSASWVKKEFKVPFVYTILLRDNGTFGHALPPDQLKPMCKETMLGLIQLMAARERSLPLNCAKAKLSSGMLIFLSNTIYFLVTFILTSFVLVFSK